MQIGPYEVIRSLGGGGMSEALLARSPQGRIVVLKRPLKRDPELLARLRDEARLGSRLFHPHLVETLDVIEHDGLPIVALGFVDGPTVDEVRKAGALGPAASARIGCHVAEALTALHGALGDDGVPMRAVHRDVTARNVVVRNDGEAVLIDLGIAKSDEDRNAKTETGMVLGTLRYLAPEIIDGRPASPASDVWALACVVYECATGTIAFSGSPGEIAGRIASADPLAQPAAAALHPQLREVLARMFVKDPAGRIGEAHEASRALRAVEEALGEGKTELATRAQQAASMVATQKHVTPQPSPSPPQPPPLAPAPVTGVAPAPPVAPAPTPLANPLAVADTAVRIPPVLLPPAPPVEQPVAPHVAPPVAAPVTATAAHVVNPVFDRQPRVLPTLARPMSAPVTLELDRPTQPRVETSGTQARREDFYPKKRRDWSWLTSGARWVFWIGVLGAGFAGWRYYEAQEQEAQDAAADYKRAEDERLLKDAMKDTGARCDGTDVGDGWAYEDARGTTVVVDSLSQVPKRFVKTARCVRVGNRR